MSKQSTPVIILLIALSLIAAQCGSAATTAPESQPATVAESAAAPVGPVIKVMAPFARASMPNGAVYMHLMNEGDADDRLISAESDVAEAVELHETRMENDVMKMSPIEVVDVPAGGSATLEPGGMHVMLLGLKKELATGDTFELTLNFEQTGSQTIQVEVQQGMVMGHSDEGHEMAENETEEMAHDHEAEGEMAASEVDRRFQVTIAAYLMDTAGFHGMDERLNDEGLIEANDADVVNRVNGVLAVVDWPEELKPQVEELQAILAQYAEALSNDDVEAAKPLATQAHELQHDLSHAIGSWLSGDNGHGEEHEHAETDSHEHSKEQGD